MDRNHTDCDVKRQEERMRLMSEDIEEDSEARKRRQEERMQRIAAMKEEKIRYEKRLLRIKKGMLFGISALCLAVAAVALVKFVLPVTGKGETEPQEQAPEVIELSWNEALPRQVEEDPPERIRFPFAASEPEKYGIYQGYKAGKTEDTGYIQDEAVVSEYAVLIDLSSGDVVAQREADTRINPASMTKILTLLVAAEHLEYEENLEDKVKVTIEITDYAFSHDLSAVGFERDEEVTVRDLLYGTILPSGGDAAYALALYIAGSEEAFVDLMNDKLRELGLSRTAHFTNCVGLYQEGHYCTVTDMAMILKAAVENELCREVLSEHIYTTGSTREHPDGITVSNLFLRRIEDKDTHGEVICAKTGFVAQSGNCAASYAVSEDGTPYICVTAKSTSAWRCIYDQVEIYTRYLHRAEESQGESACGLIYGQPAVAFEERRRCSADAA